MVKFQDYHYSIRVLLESVLRQHDGRVINNEHVENWQNGDRRVKDRCTI